MDPRILVIAKAPVPGHSKTRLSPPCSPAQAAELAEAALSDTLETVAATPCGGRTVVLDGEPGEWLPAGFEITPQVGGSLGDRLAAAFAGAGAPALLIGMDTPQVTVDLLETALARLKGADTDGVLGPSPDGGYWAIGFDGQQAGVFETVPMSEKTTGEAQLARMRELGMSVSELPQLRDVDYFDDAVRVAAQRPDGRFASVLRRMEIESA